MTLANANLSTTGVACTEVRWEGSYFTGPAVKWSHPHGKCIPTENINHIPIAFVSLHMQTTKHTNGKEVGSCS